MVDFARQFDPQPMHVDREAAARGPLQGISASGWQTTAIAMRLIVDAKPFGGGAVLGLGVDELRWPNPVRPGDVIRAEIESYRLHRRAPSRHTAWFASTSRRKSKGRSGFEHVSEPCGSHAAKRSSILIQIRMTEIRKERIAILGGGVGAMSAAFELTSTPGWQERYEITVYQMGWRLGGSASGRDQNMPIASMNTGCICGWDSTKMRSARCAERMQNGNAKGYQPEPLWKDYTQRFRRRTTTSPWNGSIRIGVPGCCCFH